MSVRARRSKRRCTRSNAAPADAKRLLCKMNEPKEERLLAMLHDSSPNGRRIAAATLVALDDLRPARPLIEALRAAEGHVTGPGWPPSADELLRFGLSRLRSLPLVEIFSKGLVDEDRRVRTLSAFALGEIGNSGAIDVLADALSDEHRPLRVEAAKALGKLRDPRAAAALVEALDDESLLVRRAASDALVKLGNDSRRHLLEAKRTGSARRRRAAGRGLRKL